MLKKANCVYQLGRLHSQYIWGFFCCVFGIPLRYQYYQPSTQLFIIYR